MKSMLLCFFVLWIRPAGPSLVVEDWALADSLIENPQFTVLVVHVLEARVVEGTRKSPPHGTLRVDEVLRGDNAVTGDYDYHLLVPRPLDIDDLEAWQDEPLHGPRPGQNLVVFAYVGDQFLPPGSSIALQGPQVLADPQTVEEIRDSLARDHLLLQASLFLVVMLAPALGLLRRRGWLSIPVGFGAYLIYELLMSNYYDIRIDLFLLWPALIGCLLMPLVMGFVRERSGRSAAP